MNVNCPCCRYNITFYSNVINDNLKDNIDKLCPLCLRELDKSRVLLACPSCGTLFDKDCISRLISSKGLNPSNYFIDNTNNNNIFRRESSFIRSTVTTHRTFYYPISTYFIQPSRMNFHNVTLHSSYSTPTIINTPQINNRNINFLN